MGTACSRGYNTAYFKQQSQPYQKLVKLMEEEERSLQSYKAPPPKPLFFSLSQNFVIEHFTDEAQAETQHLTTQSPSPHHTTSNAEPSTSSQIESETSTTQSGGENTTVSAAALRRSPSEQLMN